MQRFPGPSTIVSSSLKVLAALLLYPSIPQSMAFCLGGTVTYMTKGANSPASGGIMETTFRRVSSTLMETILAVCERCTARRHLHQSRQGSMYVVVGSNCALHDLSPSYLHRQEVQTIAGDAVLRSRFKCVHGASVCCQCVRSISHRMSVCDKASTTKCRQQFTPGQHAKFMGPYIFTGRDGGS